MLVILGGIVGQASGRLGAIVASRNKAGAYFRNGSIPTTSTTSFALAAKARMTTVTQAWQNLTAAQRLTWTEWAATNPGVNKLGQSIRLTGHAAYVGINARILAMGGASVTAPPLEPAPVSLASLSLTADIGAGNFELAFTATPLAANVSLYIRACLLDSAGINYINNYLRYIGASPGAQASPYDIEAQITTRLGTPVVDQICHVLVSTVDITTGLESAPLRAQATVVST